MLYQIGLPHCVDNTKNSSGAGGERQSFNFFLQMFYLIANTCMFGYRPEISFISEISCISDEAKIRFIELRCTRRND